MRCAHIVCMKLHDYMASTQITDAEFAKAIGRNQSTVSRLRSGKTRPDWETLNLIAKATNNAVTPNDFLSLGFEAQSNDEQLVNGEAA